MPCFLPPQSQDSAPPLRSQGPVPPALMLSFSSATAALSCHTPTVGGNAHSSIPLQKVLSTSCPPPFPTQLLQQNSSLELSIPVPRSIQPQPAPFSKDTHCTTPQLGSVVSQTPPPPGCPPSSTGDIPHPQPGSLHSLEALLPTLQVLSPSWSP